MNHKMSSRLPGEISTASGMQMIPLAEIKEELKSFLMKVKKESEKAGLKLNIQKITIMVSGSITSRQIDGGKFEAVTDSISLDFKITEGGNCSHLSLKSYDKPISVLKSKDITLLFFFPT